MGKIKYDLSPFEADKAINGALCVVLKSGCSSFAYVTNINNDGTATNEFIGAGICKYVVPNRFMITINGVLYEFDQNGNIKSKVPSEYKDCIIKLATIDRTVSFSGNAITGNTSTTVSRGDDGYTTQVDYTKNTTSIIDSLNARDEFAVHALRELLCHIPDPSVLSDSEMAHYCNTAYRWAANMMTASADARSTFKKETSDTISRGEDITSEAAVLESDLVTNTDKLLNNIIVALQRITTSETKNDVTTFFNNIKIKQFDELINAVKDGGTGGTDTATIKSVVDARIQQWLQLTTVKIGDATYSLSIPSQSSLI